MSGRLLLLWRHMVIKEFAKKRYSTSDILKACHAEVANLFFLEITQAEKKEPAAADSIEDAKDTPFQSALPIVDIAYNVRHVEEAWIHLLKAGTSYFDPKTKLGLSIQS